MTLPRLTLLKGTIWTVGAFGFSQAIRLVTNVVLTRLLVPELFGVMQLVYSLQTGIELISDVGLGQNIIYNKDADKPEFFNTAWTIQVIRGFALWLIACLATVPIARFYQSSSLLYIMPVATFGIVIGGCASTTRFLLQKRMQFGVLVPFDIANSLVAALALVMLAYFTRTVWALVLGTLAGNLSFAIGSHFLVRSARNRFSISRPYVSQILSFGKWIFVSSVVYFFSTNIDRLYLAKTIPLAILGIYGIARTLASLMNAVVVALGNSVIFPFIAAHIRTPRAELRTQLAPIRFHFLLAIAFGFAILAANSDLLVRYLYDQRYQAASWMLPILVMGAWFSILANINESTMMGLGRPDYSALANGAKCGFLFVGLLYGVPKYGVLGGVIVVAASDIVRYFPLLFGQTRERFSFGVQDAFVSCLVVVLVGFIEWGRHSIGLGTSFDNLP